MFNRVFRPSLWQAQILAVTAGLAVLALYPTDEQAILLLPVAPGSSARLAAIAVDQGAAILGRGSAGGSLVVKGTPDLAAAMFTHGVLAVHTAGTGCGGDS